MGAYLSVNAWCLCSTVMMSVADKTCSPTPTIPDTCVIDQLDKYSSAIGDFDCGSSYENCIITCGDNDKKETGCNDGDAPYIKCPTHPNCNQCILNCDRDRSCLGLTVYGYNCNTLQINIRDSNQKQMEIYAPGNNGSLIVNTEGSVFNKDAKFKQNNVYSSSQSSPTKNMIFNLNDGDDCKGNIIDASYISGNLNFECNLGDCDFTVIDAIDIAGDFNYLCGGSSDCSDTTITAQSIQGNIDIKCTDNAICSVTDTSLYGIDARLNKGNVTFTCDGSANCKSQQIYCPNDYGGVTLDECRIYCSSKGIGCANVDVFAVEGIYDVKWECNDAFSTACNSSKIHCGDHPNYPRVSEMTYINSNWDYINTDCSISPDPSAAPTQPPSKSPSQPPSTAPTKAPTTPPSNSPSNSPTTPPSNSPTSTPSNYPTQVPSNYPTQVPSNSPTTPPSRAPSSPPTNNPSLAPSLNPSLAPSFSPTKNPSSAPTSPPSTAPTNNPSVAPTMVPSFSPTACFDANNNISSVDGYEQSINNQIFDLDFITTVNANKIMIVDTPGQFYGHVFSNFSNGNKQQLICGGISSCLLSNIKFENNSVCNLKCNETLSCSNSITNFEECEQTHIICNGADSCNSMYVDISTVNNYNINIDCGVKSSCQNMIINMTGNGLSNIKCFGLNACDNLQINIEPKYYKNNYLHLFSYSNDILFSNGFGYEETDGSQQYIKCNTYDRFIRWNNSTQYTNELLEPLVLNEYSNDLFPCDGVTVQCYEPNTTNNTNNTISDCLMNFAVDISDFNIASPTPQASCYWVSVMELTRISCTGSCVTSPTHSPTPAPTSSPTFQTDDPTNAPSISPSIAPTIAPSIAPSISPTQPPSISPSVAPTQPPSLAPSIAPTLSPSLAPSIAPTQPPSLAPSIAPSLAPSLAPTLAPSIAPSISPSIAPSLAPTLAPTLAPSLAPSISPTLAPSISPSFSPSIAPTIAPTISPSGSPSQPPTLAPTIAPSISPSNAPSNNPSISPTYSPSDAPSNVPTNEPSNSPTHAPISENDFDSYIKIKYQIKYLTSTNKAKITNAPINVSKHIEYVIKKDYFFENVISYKHFMVSIEDIQGTQINDINQNNFAAWLNLDELRLDTMIECNENDNGVNYCASIQSQSQITNNFDEKVTQDLQTYFDNNTILEFSVLNPGKLNIECKNCNTQQGIDVLLIVLGVIVGIMILISFFALLFNNGLFPQLPGFFVVDNANWVSIILWSIQFWDIVSDANLSIEIWRIKGLFEPENMLLLIAAIGSVTCVIIPYIANLVIAANVKRILKDNQAAKGWFQENTALFTGLVVLCGGTYPALCVVSCCAFGLNLTTSGLTQYELKQMGKIKVFGTVILENVPQLMFQALYAYTTGITDAVALAFIASLLSVTASTLSYLIERDISDTSAVQYYLLTHCSDRQITETEREKFINNRGKTWALAEQIGEVFGIPNKNLEVGFSMITKHGIITHMVHYVYESDLEAMEDELKEHSPNQTYDITPKLFTTQLYASLRKEISDVFRKHFDISDEFNVEHAPMKLGMRKRTRSKYRTFDEPPKSPSSEGEGQEEEKKYDMKQTLTPTISNIQKHVFSLAAPKKKPQHTRRSTVLKQIVVELEMSKFTKFPQIHEPQTPAVQTPAVQTPSSNSEMNENKVMLALNSFFNVKDIQNQQDKIDLMTQLLVDDEEENKVDQEENKMLNKLMIDTLEERDRIHSTSIIYENEDELETTETP